MPAPDVQRSPPPAADWPTRAHPTHPVVREVVARGAARESGEDPTARGTRLGLVVQGGAMRGLHSGAALVALEQLGLTDVFDVVVGCSAGAINSCFFLAGQAEFGSSIYTDHLTTRRFANPLRWRKVLDVDHVVDDVIARQRPLDVDRVLSSRSRLIVTVTRSRDGSRRAVDVKADGLPLLEVLRATSAAVPLYDRMIDLDGEPHCDGGVHNPLPLDVALELGCTHVLVLLTVDPLTRPVRPGRLARTMLTPFLREWPPDLRQHFFERRFAGYDRALGLATGRLPAGADVASIAPCPSGPRITRVTIDRALLDEAGAIGAARTRELFEAARRSLPTDAPVAGVTAASEGTSAAARARAVRP